VSVTFNELIQLRPYYNPLIILQSALIAHEDTEIHSIDKKNFNSALWRFLSV